MTTEKRQRSNYTEDFKRDAVALDTEQGYKISEAARSLDVGANLIGRWRRQFEEEASGVRLSGDEREELRKRKNRDFEDTHHIATIFVGVLDLAKFPGQARF